MARKSPLEPRNPKDDDDPMTFGRWMLMAGIVWAGLSAGFAQEPGRAAKGDLRVGLFQEEPFVMKTPFGPEGFCVELWARIMEEHGWKSAYRFYSSASEVFTALERKEIDVGVGPFYIRSDRAQSVDFTHPFHESGLQIMVNTERYHTLGRLWNGLVEGGHIKILLAGAAIILALTHILLFFEWKTNPQFPRGYFPGFADCFYHIMSICMTGKATHRGLPGPWGKILAGLWLAGGVAVVAYITSTLTSVMTANKLRGSVHSVTDLAGQRVGTIAGSGAERACAKYGFVLQLYPDLPSAVSALVRQSVNGIVFDTFALRYYDRLHPELPLGEVGQVFEKSSIGFVLPLNSPLRLPINQSLLRMKEDGYLHTLDSKFFEAVEN